MKICVFCGSKTGNDPRLMQLTYELGEFFASQNIELIYGGGKVGLMGRIADGVLAGGGRVTGIIPDFLSTEEVARLDLTTLEVVASMDARKKRMFELADLFLTLPGGLGTFDELFEAVTLRQIGILNQPSMIWNYDGYYSPLKMQLFRMKDAGFITDETMDLCQFVENFEEIRAAILKAKAGLNV